MIQQTINTAEFIYFYFSPIPLKYHQQRCCEQI